MSNPQLPTELEAEIREKAKEYAQSFGRSEFGYYAVNWEAGATAYAVKLLEAQQEIESLTNQLKKQNEVQVENMKLLREENERLKGWKSEASTLLDPIFDYAENNLKIRLGKGKVDAVIDHSKRATLLLTRLSVMVSAGKQPEKQFLNEIKTFLDGK